MAKNNEKFEEILDELHENKQALESLKNEFNSFKKEILDKLPENATAQSPNPQLAQATNHVTVEFSEPKEAAHDTMEANYSKSPIGSFSIGDFFVYLLRFLWYYVGCIFASFWKQIYSHIFV